MLREPPSRFDAAWVDGKGVRTVSNRRRIERAVHSGERAASVSDSWVRAPRIPSTAAEPAVGIDEGSASNSPTCRAMLIGSRNVAWTKPSMVSTVLGGGTGSGSGVAARRTAGEAPSRVRSTYCIDMRTPLIPSVTV